MKQLKNILKANFGLDNLVESHETNFERLYSRHGVLKSTKELSKDTKFDADQFFQYREKAEVALSVASMYWGGDFMEFGSTDLNTFRNFLSAFDIFNLQARFPDTNFYGFDIFGDISTSDDLNDKIDMDQGYRRYINYFSRRGDLYEENLNLLKSHDLFLDKCYLIKGFFEDTLTLERKTEYVKSGREVGFACLDCNIAPPYKVVFEYLVDIVRTKGFFIYMDEYFTNDVSQYFDQFMMELKRRRNMEARYLRNAGGFGGLFYVYQKNENLLPLSFDNFDLS